MNYTCDYCGTEKDGKPDREVISRIDGGELIRVPLCPDCTTEL